MYFTTISGLTIGLIALTTFLVASGTTILYAGYKTKEESIAAAKRDKKALQLAMKEADEIIADYNSYYTMLTTAETHFEKARKLFKDGGYVLDGKPLGDEEFSTLLGKISSAKKAITMVNIKLASIKNEFNTKISECDKVINQ